MGSVLIGDATVALATTLLLAKTERNAKCCFFGTLVSSCENPALIVISKQASQALTTGNTLF
jgi:hypothetical protein